MSATGLSFRIFHMVNAELTSSSTTTSASPVNTLYSFESSIMGLMNDPENHVQLLLDKDVKAGEFIGCHPCINTSSLKLYTKDIFEKFLPAVHHEPIFVELTGE